MKLYSNFILSTLLICTAAFLLGMGFERTREKELITVYTPTDIIYADLNSLIIDFEVSRDRYRFRSAEKMFSYIEQKSADNSSMMGEYQVYLNFDTIEVYQYGRYVDCYITGETLNQFDEILAIDNR